MDPIGDAIDAASYACYICYKSAKTDRLEPGKINLTVKCRSELVPRLLLFVKNEGGFDWDPTDVCRNCIDSGYKSQETIEFMKRNGLTKYWRIK
jgi:hypothetical protein